MVSVFLMQISNGTGHNSFNDNKNKAIGMEFLKK
jgi:hypothetical protein